MSMFTGETEGIVLFQRAHREKDKLVKIFTESYGKRMFFARRAALSNNAISSAIMPYTRATYYVSIQDEGLSFLNATKNVEHFREIQDDIFISAYATYILNLVDLAIEDGVYDPFLYQFTYHALNLLNEKKDPEIIRSIFEIQVMERFGVKPQLSQCVICGETKSKFDYSAQYNGVLCEKHWDKDIHRYHADPRAIFFIQKFSVISMEKLETLSLNSEIKIQIRRVIDQLYDEYIGIHPKSKKFIEDMVSWESMIQPLKPRGESDSGNSLS